MALPSIGGGRQFGDGNINEPILGTQAAPPATKAAAATLTAAELAGGIITTTPTGAIDLTLPTAALTEAQFNNAKVDSSFDFYVINLTAATHAATLVVGTGWTLVGAGAVSAATSAHFRARKTGDNAYTCYRIS
jgi:hypothetical protein